MQQIERTEGTGTCTGGSAVPSADSQQPGARRIAGDGRKDGRFLQTIVQTEYPSLRRGDFFFGYKEILRQHPPETHTTRAWFFFKFK
jgi:hypothetical protein